MPSGAARRGIRPLDHRGSAPSGKPDAACPGSPSPSIAVGPRGGRRLGSSRRRLRHRSRWRRERLARRPLCRRFENAAINLGGDVCARGAWPDGAGWSVSLCDGSSVPGPRRGHRDVGNVEAGAGPEGTTSSTRARRRRRKRHSARCPWCRPVRFEPRCSPREPAWSEQRPPRRGSDRVAPHRHAIALDVTALAG